MLQAFWLLEDMIGLKKLCVNRSNGTNRSSISHGGLTAIVGRIGITSAMSLIRKGAKLESAFQANPFPRPCTPISAKGTCRRVPRGAWSKRYTPAEPLAPLVRVERGCAGWWSNRQIVAPNGNTSAFSNTQPARIKPVTVSAEGE